jgi:hypothetical protein
MKEGDLINELVVGMAESRRQGFSLTLGSGRFERQKRLQQLWAFTASRVSAPLRQIGLRRTSASAARASALVAARPKTTARQPMATATMTTPTSVRRKSQPS